MKFSVATLLVVVPLVSQAAAVSVPRQFDGFRGGRGRFGNNNNNNKGNKGANNTNQGANGTGAGATNSTTATANNSTAAATGNSTDAGANTGDPQTSLTLDPRVIAPAFANDGQDVPAEGQVSSLTSTNNFINFCLTTNFPITNGQQITTGSCNPAPIGTIPSVDNMPSAKFTFPKNGGTVTANQAFTINMQIKNLATGNFVNANENYFAAPQQLNAQGQIIGHSHVVVEALTAIDQTTPTDPQKFAFFKGLNDAAVGGALTADVTSGLPAGAYRLCSINTCANHQPAIVPVAQHGSLDDCIYFSATADGQPDPNAAGIAASATAVGAAATASGTAAAAAASGTAAAAAAASGAAAAAGASGTAGVAGTAAATGAAKKAPATSAAPKATKGSTKNRRYLSRL